MSFELYARPGTPHVRDGLFFVIRKNGDLSIMREVASQITGERPPPDEFLVDLYYDQNENALAVKASQAGRLPARKNGRTWVVAAPDFFEAFEIQLYAATRYPAEQFGEMWGCRLVNGVRTGRPKRFGAAVPDADTQLSQSIRDLDFAVRSTNALENNGITTVRALLLHSAADLVLLPGIGGASVADIEAVLEVNGLSLAEGGGE